MMLGRTLEQWGFDVVVAHDGAAAWDHTSATSAMFSHGICPSCLVKVMEELDPPAVPSPTSGA